MGGFTPEFQSRMGQFVFDGLVQRGMPEHIAQGFVMNFKDESALIPDLNEAAPIVPGSRGGYGFAQWTGPRRRNLEAYAQEQGVPVSDPNMQLDFLMSELNGPESAAYRSMLATNNPQDAAVAIVNKFERPAEEHRARRAAQYAGATAPSYSATAMGEQKAIPGVPGPSAAPQNALSGNLDKLALFNMLRQQQDQQQSPYNFLMS